MANESNLADGTTAAPQSGGTLSADTPEARAYNRQHRLLSIADTAVSFAVLIALWASHGTVRLRDAAVHIATASYALQIFVYVVMLAVITKVVGVGLEYYSFRLEHRYHLSNQKLGGWVADQIKGWLLGVALGAAAAEVVYFAIRRSELWWLWSWAVFTIFFVLLAQLAPVVLLPLFYTFKPLEDAELRERLVKLSERAGTRVRGVYEWKLSEKSKKANAALTGLANTRRIILADTLLENYSHDEIEAVLAHELGHHVHKHIVKSIVVQAVITLLGFWLADISLRYVVAHSRMFEGVWDFADLPVLALVASVLSLLLLPAMNAFSRHNERQADDYCWRSIPDVRPFVTAMTRLSEQNLSEKTPSRLVEVLFHSHPSISKRIAAAEAWSRSARKLRQAT